MILSLRMIADRPPIGILLLFLSPTVKTPRRMIETLYRGGPTTKDPFTDQQRVRSCPRDVL